MNQPARKDGTDYEAILRRLQTPLAGLSAVLVGAAVYVVFMAVPDERVMGAVQRIFYFHVGSAVACYLGFGLVFLFSLGYLAFRERPLDLLNEAAAEVGFLFCTITLASGMIWGHSAWNTWFRWEPRLVTFLLLWLIFLSFNLLRLFGDTRKLGAHSAVLGILGAVTVPAVWLSVKLLPQVAQLHPQVVETGGLKHPMFKVAMFLTMAALVLFEAVLIVARARIGFLKDRMEEGAL